MPVEIEAKMSVESFDPVRAALREAGARPAGSRFEVNTFFDTADRALLSAGQGLRVRLERDDASGAERHVVTWKGPRQAGAVKSREELELEVRGGDAAALFERLGYARRLSFEKRRETWSFGGCKIELDEVPRLGRFVEVEGPDERTVLSVRDRIGLSHRPLITDGYASLLASHLRERGQPLGHVGFDNPARA